MCFAVSINVLPWSLMFSSNYKCFAVADMGHRSGAISLVKLRKVSQIRENSPWVTLFAIHFYSNLYHCVVPGSDFRIYNLASLFTPREAISSLLLDQCLQPM
jgi:hypothetical protein